MRTIRLKSIGESPKTPLLEPARRYHPFRVEITGQDWEDMNRKLEELRVKRSGSDIALMLYFMKSIDESKAPKVTDDDWELIIKLQGGKIPTRGILRGISGVMIKLREGKIRRDEVVQERLHYMKSIDETRALKITDSEWGDMNRRLAYLRGEGRRSIRLIARQLHHMKFIDEARAPKPTEQDWKDMNKLLEEEGRGRHDGSLIAQSLYWMRFLDESRAPKPSDRDWEDMNDWLDKCRKEHEGWWIASMLHKMKFLEEKTPDEGLQPLLPPLRKF